MVNITDFLLAQIAKDEAEIEDAHYVPADHWWLPEAAYADRLKAECEAKRKIIEDHGWDYTDPYESWKGDEYRAKWGDSRDDKDCKRCGGVSYHPNLGEVERRDSWPCPTLRALAAVYADHPDYNPEWSTS